jgi:hypothetical protein
MKRLLSLLAPVLVVAVATGATARSSATAARAPLLATQDDQSSSRLFYVDPISLEPIGAASLPLDFHWGTTARSPDGSLLTLSRNDGAELRFVRLPDLRFAGSMTVLGGQFVDLVAWRSPRPLLALVGSTVAAVDPTARKVLWRRPIPGSILSAQPAPGGVVILAAPADKIGSARIAMVATDGSVRSVVLDRVPAGFKRKQGTQDFVATMRTPGLAVDPQGNRAFVVAAGAPVAEVALGSMHVVYHGGSRTPVKAISGSRRDAIWLGNGMLAVSGTDSRVHVDRHGNVQQSSAPSGVVLIDTRTWTSRSLQPDANEAIAVGGSLLAYRAGYDSSSHQTGSGLTVYRADGTPFVHLLDRTAVSWVQAQGGLAYVWLSNENSPPGRNVVVVDPTSGAILARETRPIVLLTGS